MAQLYEDELYDESVGRSAKRPMLKAASLVAIAALGVCGLYQGIRFTFRDTGPAPHYPQIASAPAGPMAAPEPQAASDESRPPAARPKVELADNDAAPPADGLPSMPGTAPVQPPLIPVAAFPAQQGPAVDPSALVMAPPGSAPAPAPDQPPP